MRRRRSIAGRVAAGILAATLVFTAQTPWIVSAESEGENVLTEQEETAQQEETVELPETEDGGGNEANMLEMDTGTIVPQESTIVPETETGDSENNGLEDSEEPKELTAPQNLREENGDIVWDKVKGAYGYCLRAYKGESEYEYIYYINRVELDRLCYEQKMDFGDYRFEVCSFDESRNRSEWSESITATYAPALAAPANVRVSEERDETVVWDEVEDATRYNIRVFNDDDDRTLYTTDYTSGHSYSYSWWWSSGDYLITIQAMDKDYNVSEWTEPVLVSHTVEVREKLETPQNVRLDESGDNILWDEVEGAGYYYVCIESWITDSHGNQSYYYDSWYTAESLLNNWKTYIHPFSEGEIENKIKVFAGGGSFYSSDLSDSLDVSFITRRDETIDVPDSIRVEKNYLRWDDVDGERFWVRITVNGELIEEWNGTVDSYGCYIGNQFPGRNYNVEIFVVDQKGNYNSQTYTMCHDETIGVPDSIRVEDGYLRWDDVDGERFWVRITVNGELIEEWNGTVDSYGHYIGNEFPAGNYDVELFVVDQKGNYNSKTYTLTLDTVPDETVWVPEIFYKFDTLLWDYDRLRHDDTYYFWIRIKNTKDDTVVRLVKRWSEYYYEMPNLPNGHYTVEVCVREYGDKIGAWSKQEETQVHDGSLFDKENEVSTEIEPSPGAEEIPEEDRITSITINPAFNMKHKDGDDVELDLTKIQIKANEIYDEEGLRRAEEALGQELKGNKHYNLLDLTLLYDGEDFSNGYEGLVQVIIPIPAGHRDKTFSCYRLTEVDGKMVKEMIPGERIDDSYIIYLEHFSEYALVADGGEGEGEEEHTHTYGNSWINDENGHWKECECGEKSEEADHTYGNWEVTKEATETEEGIQERTCEVCGYKQTESVPKLTPSTPPEPSKPSTPSVPSGGHEKPVEPGTTPVSIVPIDPESNEGKNIVAEAEVEAQKGIASYEEVHRIAQYDIKSSTTTPENPLTLSLSIPDIAVNDKIIVMHKTANGWVQEKDVKITANGTIQVTVTSCSPFVFFKVTGYDGWAGVPASDKAKMMSATQAGATSPKTGDAGVIGFMLIAAACGLCLVLGKKKIV